MIAGGAAYRYWALKSPVPIRAREPEKGSTIVRPEPFRPDGINLYLIDSPDFHGLRRAFALGPFSFAAAGFISAAATRPEASPSPGRI
jgi:hypothetical protein